MTVHRDIVDADIVRCNEHRYTWRIGHGLVLVGLLDNRT